MNDTTPIKEAESVTRSIARWGSAAAAVIFGLAFVTDETMNAHIASGQAVHIALVVAIFVGYALAWMERFELLGSVIAIAAMTGVYVYCGKDARPNPFFLAVAAPALFHLAAVVFHRSAQRRSKNDAGQK